jgi:hypothetical protein
LEPLFCEDFRGGVGEEGWDQDVRVGESEAYEGEVMRDDGFGEEKEGYLCRGLGR